MKKEEEKLAIEDENRRLNTYIEEILSDISERAPVLKREREDYARLLDQVGPLTLTHFPHYLPGAYL